MDSGHAAVGQHARAEPEAVQRRHALVGDRQIGGARGHDEDPAGARRRPDARRRSTVRPVAPVTVTVPGSPDPDGRVHGRFGLGGIRPV